ncbi:NAD(P)/FAD-dependent oxidoreductase [Candidatus Woesearchaeota archaeon]|nr:NAD(P)/FAD-dependent oxidoreductase [Candidatus Woesearchaeota archaeon]
MKAAVIGAGVGGLVCANLLANKGYDVTVFEAHDRTGGLAQTWKRKGGIFETIHILNSIQPGERIHDLLEECGCDMSQLGRIGTIDTLAYFLTPKKEYVLPATLDEFIGMIAEHPDAGILGFADLVEKVQSQRDPRYLSRTKRWIEQHVNMQNDVIKKLVYCMTRPTLVRRHRQTYRQVLDEFFDNEHLKTALSALHGFTDLPPSKASALVNLMVLGSYWKEGGPCVFKDKPYQALHDELEEALKRKGGEVRLGSEVTEINIKNGKFIRANGHEYHADTIVIACDVKKAAKMIHPRPEKYLQKAESMEMTGHFIGLHGIMRKGPDLSRLKAAATVLASSESVIENGTRFPDEYEIYIMSPTVLRPDAGLLRSDDKEIISMVMHDTTGNWKEKRQNDLAAYRAEKNAIAEQMIDIADRFFPGLKENLEWHEACTTATIERYCNTTGGAAYAFSATPHQFMPNGLKPRIAPGLYVTGSTLICGGVAAAATAGKKTAETVLYDLARAKAPQAAREYCGEPVGKPA